MPRDLLAEAGISPKQYRGRDLLAESGIQPEETMTGSLSKIPGYALDAAVNLPRNIINVAKQVPGAAKNIVTNPINSARDLAGGVARGSQNLAAALLEGGDYITTKGAEALLKANGYKDAKVPKWNAREFMGLEGENQVDLGKMIESQNPNALLSGIGQYGLGGAVGGARAIPMLAANTANAAIQASPGQRVQAGTEGFVNAAAPIGLLKGSEALRPSKMFRGQLTPEELQKNRQAAQGTNTNLGRVIESPTMARTYENIIPYAPFSGGYKSMQQTASQIKNQGLDIMKDLGIDEANQPKSRDLANALKDASKVAKREKTAKYNALNKAADEAKVNVNRENLSATAGSMLDNLEANPELTRTIPSKVMEDLKFYAENNNPTSLETSDKLKGILNSEASSHFRNGNDFLYGHYKSLADAIEKDSEYALDASANPKVQQLRQEARDYYKNTYQPTREKEILNLTRKNANPHKALRSYLGGHSDDTQLLESMLKSIKLVQQESLPSQVHLARSFNKTKTNPRGGFDPRKLGELYGDLGEDQAKVLFPDEKMRNRLNDYQNLVKMNEKSLNTMFNPPTGQTALDYFMKGGLPTSLAIAGSTIGGPLGALAGYLTGAVGPGLASRPMLKYLTNEKTRNKLIKSMMENKSKFDTPAKTQSLVAALQSMNNRNQ